MEGDERVVVRLSREDVDLLNDLASRHVYESASAAARAAVEEFLASRFGPEERARALSDAEKRRSADPGKFTADGEDAEKVLTGVITRGMDGKSE